MSITLLADRVRGYQVKRRRGVGMAATNSSDKPGDLLWLPCVADADIIFLPCGFFYLSFFFFSLT